MEKKKILVRDSNIELLRIIAAMGVIALHYNNPLAGNAFSLAEEGFNLFFLKVVESLFACSVNLFVLISGYYMSNTRKIQIEKYIQMFIQLMIFNLIFFIIEIVGQKDFFSISGLVFSVLPRNWFIILYIVLCFLAPFLNILLDNLSNQGRIFFIILIVCLFSVYPTVVDYLGYFCNIGGMSSISSSGSLEGYTIINFIMMYCIGAVIRQNEKPISTRLLLLLLFINTGIILGLSYLPRQIMWLAWEYCSPFVVIQAVLIFNIFNNIKMKQSNIVNILSPASLVVYLTHSYFLKFAEISIVAKSIFLPLHLLITCLSIYFLGWLIYKIYDYSFNIIVHKLTSFIPIKSIDVGTMEK